MGGVGVEKKHQPIAWRLIVGKRRLENANKKKEEKSIFCLIYLLIYQQVNPKGKFLQVAPLMNILTLRP